MTPEERDSLRLEIVKGARTQNLLEPALAKALAVSHLFERSSIARELHAAGMLLRRGIGRVSVEQAKAFAFQDPRFVRPNPGARIVTTREVLHEESEMLQGVDSGRGRYEEIGRGGSWNPTSLVSDEQKAAVEHILRSRDLVIAIRGVAGTGKTTMIKEAVLAMAALSGREVLLFAPSSAATQVLKEQGFNASDTVQSLMTNTIVQDATRGKIVLVDEAGFLSAKQMRWLVKFAGENQCRLVLCGDSRQHHAVERGDSLRVLERTGALEPAALTKIFRQKIPALRDAIQELARGNTKRGFDKLDAFGAIQEVEDQVKRLEAIAQKHVEAVKEKKSSLVVAPTHGECRQIANAVRQAMRNEGILASAEESFVRLQKLNLTVSQRQDSINYEVGNVIEFHRRAAGGFRSGEQWEVAGRVSCSQVVVRRGQANEAQFYVSMSRAREAMHLFTDSKAALREAVTRPSSRLSPWELITDQTAIERLQSASRYLRAAAAEQTQREQARQAERTMER
jgi:hypothetical protein